MRKHFGKGSMSAVLAAGVLAFAATSPAQAASASQDWFEQQRAITDGGGPAVVPAPVLSGARGRVGEPRVAEPAVNPERQAESGERDWLLEQLRRSDGLGE
jgi:hypothetical protein